MKFTHEVKMGGSKISGLGNAVNADDAVNKGQLDAAIQGWKWKDTVKAATTANITLSGTQTIDTVALVANDRVLVKNQTTGSANGIYIVAAGSWTRATDFDAATELDGATVFVSQGSVHGNQTWQLTTDSPITLGTTALVFNQVGGGTSYTQGTGISISGSTIAIDNAVVVRKYSANVGNASLTSIVVNHALNNDAPHVQVWETTGSKELVMCDVEMTDANNVTLKFATAPAAGAYKVVVFA